MASLMNDTDFRPIDLIQRKTAQFVLFNSFYLLSSKYPKYDFILFI